MALEDLRELSLLDRQTAVFQSGRKGLIGSPCRIALLGRFRQPVGGTADLSAETGDLLDSSAPPICFAQGMAYVAL